ncbi:hypothetical protein ACXZ1K_05215 [Pedobacter sp. PWIIR3]
MKLLLDRLHQSRYWVLFKIILYMMNICFLCWLLPHYNLGLDPTAGYIDPTIWMLILLSLLCVPVVIGISALLLSHLWRLIGLPAPRNMVSQFNTLPPWQKLKLLYASYALLALVGVGCLIAIC